MIQNQFRGLYCKKHNKIWCILYITKKGPIFLVVRMNISNQRKAIPPNTSLVYSLPLKQLQKNNSSLTKLYCQKCKQVKLSHNCCSSLSVSAWEWQKVLKYNCEKVLEECTAHFGCVVRCPCKPVTWRTLTIGLPRVGLISNAGFIPHKRTKIGFERKFR